MAKMMREIISIDEALCDGCGQCILSCAEGALKIIDGKAKLVSDTLCDGFGNCVGTCPKNAITIIKRDAESFDEEAVEKQRRTLETKPDGMMESHRPLAIEPISSLPQPGDIAFASRPHAGGCPGSAARMFPAADTADDNPSTDGIPSQLTQWPVQLTLVPPTAPFLKGREILLAADCCPFAYAGFHRDFLKGRALLVGCPKLDDLDFYRQKLEDIFRRSGCTAVTVMMMEVPCCGGLKIIARQALQASGRDIPFREVIIGVRGDILHEA